MGIPVTQKKSLEDMLAEYTEDLMAERRPRISADIATLDEDERLELMALLAIVRRMMAAHREVPPPRYAFLESLDSFVRGEIVRQVAPDSLVSQPRVSSKGKVSPGVEAVPLRRRILQGAREFFSGPGGHEAGRGWRFVGIAVVVIVLGLQALLYAELRRLEKQNQTLVARLKRLGPSGNLIPLELPRDQLTGGERRVETPAQKSPEDVLAGVELRARIEQRIGELERGLASKTGRDRQAAEAVLRDLRMLLQPAQGQ
jgi:hypothetical protein